MNVLITLDEPLGSDLGNNFLLTTDIDSVIPSGATRTELINGLIVLVDDNATQITVTSDPTGLCSGSILNLNIVGKPSTTTFTYQWFHTNTGNGDSNFSIGFSTNPIDNLLSTNTGDNSGGVITQIAETGVIIRLSSTDPTDNLQIVIKDPTNVVSIETGQTEITILFNFQSGMDYIIEATTS
jgi:hypothetical protein